MISKALRLARLGLAGIAFMPAVPGPAQSLNCVDYPVSLRRLLLPGGSATYTIDVEGTYAYVASGLSGLFVIDATVPDDAAMVGDVNTPGDARDVAVQGAFAYVADMTAGLQVVDVSDPSAPPGTTCTCPTEQRACSSRIANATKRPSASRRPSRVRRSPCRDLGRTQRRESSGGCRRLLHPTSRPSFPGAAARNSDPVNAPLSSAAPGSPGKAAVFFQ